VHLLIDLCVYASIVFLCISLLFMVVHTCCDCQMIDKITGPTKLSQIYNNNNVRIKDIGLTSLRSLQSYVKFRQLCGVVGARRISFQTS